MKKTVLLIAMAIVAFSASAQDTLNVRGPMPSYFDWGFPQLLPGDVVSLRLVSRPDFEGRWADVAISMEAGQDSLIVYGIAASLITPRDNGWAEPLNEVADTSYTYVMDNLRLYRSTGQNTAEQIGEDLLVHLGTTPVSFYMNTEFQTRTPDVFAWPILPVYERYFSEPQKVSGMFYVGISNPQVTYTDYEILEHYHVYIAAFQSAKCTTAFHYYSRYIGEDNSIYHKPNWYSFEIGDMSTGGIYSGIYPYIFPILRPDPENTSDDTLAVEGAEMLQRLTGVLPNPAAEKVRVVSSFGMSMVEVFDLNGTAVLKRRTDGLYTDIDVSHWPAGTYLVRIHTPQGIATKKLVVSR